MDLKIPETTHTPKKIRYYDIEKTDEKNKEQVWRLSDVQGSPTDS